MAERRGPKRTVPRDSVQTTIHVQKKLLRDFQAFAIRQGTSVSAFVNKWMRETLDAALTD